MVANIDNWLFRLADNKKCEPEVDDRGVITCTKCDICECPYWEDFNEV